MAGRGRGMTLPAWMTGGAGVPGVPGIPGVPGAPTHPSPPPVSSFPPPDQASGILGAGASSPMKVPGLPDGVPQGRGGPSRPGYLPFPHPGAPLFSRPPSSFPAGPGSFQPGPYGAPGGYPPQGPYSRPPGAPGVPGQFPGQFAPAGGASPYGQTPPNWGPPGGPMGVPGAAPPGTIMTPQGPVPLPPPGSGSGGQSAVAATPRAPATSAPAPGESPATSAGADGTPSGSAAEWQEHTAKDGRRYYYNKRTQQSSWEKPLDLMNPQQREDARTPWREFKTAQGHVYYYNKTTTLSSWTTPPELQAARDKAGAGVAGSTAPVSGTPGTLPGTQPVAPTGTPGTPASTPGFTPPGGGVSGMVPPFPGSFPGAAPGGVPLPGMPPVSASGIAPGGMQGLVSGSDASSCAGGFPVPVPAVGGAALNAGVPPAGADSGTPGAATSASAGGVAPSGGVGVGLIPPSSVPGVTSPEVQVSSLGGVINMSPVVPVKLAATPLIDVVYATKAEAKAGFKEMLESVGVQYDWTWDQALRKMANHRQYSALKTLGEKKQAFHEFITQKKKQEIEEHRLQQKKAREEFLIMLDESKQLKSSMRWAKASELFERDPRCQAVEDSKEREELYEDYMVDLVKKEKEKAREERKKNMAAFREFLETCELVKVNTQWRKVQDQMEENEACARLDKIDRLEVYQEYVKELEKREEEERVVEKERVRRQERKNRDGFRTLMDTQRVTGNLHAKTRWREFCSLVKDDPLYSAASSNTSGSTPKELFEDALEDLDKTYKEDKESMKEVIKSHNLSITGSTTLEEMRESLEKAAGPETLQKIDTQNVKGFFVLCLPL